jgi:hypothetical protein
MKPRVRKQSQVETSWCYNVKKPNFLLQENIKLFFKGCHTQYIDCSKGKAEPKMELPS